MEDDGWEAPYVDEIDIDDWEELSHAEVRLCSHGWATQDGPRVGMVHAPKVGKARRHHVNANALSMV